MALLQKDGATIDRIREDAPAPILRPADHGCKLSAGRFILDRHDCSVTDRVTGSIIELSRLEYKLLDALMRNWHQPVARDVIEADVLKRAPGCKPTNAIDVYVNYLRKKLGRDAILTVRGFGYQFNTAFDLN